MFNLSTNPILAMLSPPKREQQHSFLLSIIVIITCRNDGGVRMITAGFTDVARNFSSVTKYVAEGKEEATIFNG